MRRNWINKRVDLALLVSEIVEFLKANDFEIIKGEKRNGYQMLAEGSSTFRMDGYIKIIVEGKPENFMVNVERCGEKNRRYLSPILTSMLGGGYFYLKRLKSEEVWIKLEKELWKSIENAVLRLTGSAQLSR